jgi:hypothetical protein
MFSLSLRTELHARICYGLWSITARLEQKEQALTRKRIQEFIRCVVKVRSTFQQRNCAFLGTHLTGWVPSNSVSRNSLLARGSAWGPFGCVAMKLDAKLKISVHNRLFLAFAAKGHVVHSTVNVLGRTIADGDQRRRFGWRATRLRILVQERKKI